MKFRVLALDYDGTIAQNGRLDPDVRSAIIEARSRGLVVVLVTGRILGDLLQVAGDLSFLDAIVSENGAVVTFPSGTSRLIGYPPPQEFVQELHRRGIPISVGQCVVEAAADFSSEILSVIREFELPLLLLFNRSRLMVLPQGVSKGAGLHAALSALRLSVHNAIGIGDAENDHDLLTTCEIGVAVGWGSKTLQESADEVLEGNGPAAVAAYLRRTMGELKLPPERMGRHRLSLGTFDDGSPLAFSMRGRNVLIAGDAQSGKSWVAGLACEQMILQGYSVCVVDPEGDYRTLEPLPGVVVLGGDNSPPQLPDVALAVRHPDMSLVIDLSHVPHPEKVEYLYTLLPLLAAIRRTTGLPHRIVVDEAHHFLHKPNIRDLLDFNLGAYTLITYRLSDLHPDVRQAVEVMIVKRISDPQEVRTLIAMVKDGRCESEWKSNLDKLTLSQAALLLGAEGGRGTFRCFELLPRLTSHVRHKAKYLDVQLIGEQAFVFTADGRPLGAPARTLKEFCSALNTYSASILRAHANRDDFSKWIDGVFHDHLLASQIRIIEQRCKLNHGLNVARSLTKAIYDRYEFSPNNYSTEITITSDLYQMPEMVSSSGTEHV
jgi:hydroxymethylpyrimidine pyrophosphatase-like HAD family hydrolase